MSSPCKAACNVAPLRTSLMKAAADAKRWLSEWARHSASGLRKKSKRAARASTLATAMVVTLANFACADSLWNEHTARPIVADKRAVAVGDILNIVVQENNSASKDNSTKTSKESAIDASISSFLYSPGASSFLTKKGALPALKVDGKNSFNGGGTINNSEKIIARVPVTVVDVLPNKNLVVEGKRKTSFSGESQDVVLRGVVRPDDIAANNTIFSYNVADATIQFVSRGTVTDNQRKGWFTKFWEKLTPF
ncbi:MAG TPA: flagellar basal body L-ring protein FlgH [Verrucomicrobiae bacterium]